MTLSPGCCIVIVIHPLFYDCPGLRRECPPVDNGEPELVEDPSSPCEKESWPEGRRAPQPGVGKHPPSLDVLIRWCPENRGPAAQKVPVATWEV